VNAGHFLLVTLLASWASDRYKLRTIAIVCSSALSATGYIIYLCKLCLPVHKKYPSRFTGASHRYTLYGSLFLTASGVYSIPPVLSAWISNNSEPHYRRAIAIALSAVFTNFVRVSNFTNYTIAFFVSSRNHFYRAVFSVPGRFRYQRHPDIETRVFSIWYCKLPIPVCLDYSFAQDVVFTSVLLLGFTAILNGSLLHWWNKKKQDPVRRQELLAPYFENVDVEVEEDSGSEHDRNGRAHRKAWLDLGDKHPDFQYVI